MKEFLPLVIGIILLSGCSQIDENSEVLQNTTENTVAVDTNDSANQVNEQDTQTFTFGRVNYELDYPSTWTYGEETYDSGSVYTQFYDNNNGKTMMIDCDWQGGMEAEILKSDNRTFEKQGELVEVTYTVFGTEDNVSNRNVSLSLAEWSEEKSWDYYCKIFFEPKVTETSILEEIFSSIR